MSQHGSAFLLECISSFLWLHSWPCCSLHLYLSRKTRKAVMGCFRNAQGFANFIRKNDVPLLVPPPTDTQVTCDISRAMNGELVSVLLPKTHFSEMGSKSETRTLTSCTCKQIGTRRQLRIPRSKLCKQAALSLNPGLHSPQVLPEMTLYHQLHEKKVKIDLPAFLFKWSQLQAFIG